MASMAPDAVVATAPTSQALDQLLERAQSLLLSEPRLACFSVQVNRLQEI